ncbi:DUF4907 domain-containing protein [uncultured Microscilla sp.]|uniref:DUF4907 domain-containing protein n=1 Tax=uncultured Microscilla sp. TaxID=432653 RepID=UPI002621F7BE|nr:DUF4907 domain-containing protein [uncultured Microscilla sp.]
MKQFSLFCLLLLWMMGACKPSDSKGSGNQKDSSSHSTTDQPSKPNKPQGNTPAVNPYAEALFETKIIDGEEGTFGYEITAIVNGKTQRIRQTHKPSLPGIKGFDTKAQAQKVADFVVNKIKTQGFPPTVTPEELAQLGIVK